MHGKHGVLMTELPGKSTEYLFWGRVLCRVFVGEIGGFLSCGAQDLEHTGTAVEAHWFLSSCGVRMWDLSSPPGIEPESPALEG